MTLDIYGACPQCGASWDAGWIPEDARHYYSPPYKYSRLVGVYDVARDRTTHHRCPDCGAEFPR